MKLHLVRKFTHFFAPHAAAVAPAPSAPNLPDDVLEQVLQRLPARDLLAAAAVSRDWRRLVLARPTLWEPHLRTYGGDPAQQLCTQVRLIAKQVAIDARLRAGRGKIKSTQGRCNHELTWSPDGGRLSVGATPGSWQLSEARRCETLIDATLGQKIASIPHRWINDRCFWSADGRAFVQQCRTNWVQVVDASRGRVVATFGDGATPEWNARRTQFVVVEGENLHLYDCQRMEQRPPLITTYPCQNARWAPAGERLAAQHETGAQIIDVPTGKAIMQLQPPAAAPLVRLGGHAMQWSPTGEHLLVDWGADLVSIHDVQTKAALTTARTDARVRPVWSNDGRTAAVTNQGNICLLSVDAPQRVLQVGGSLGLPKWNGCGAAATTLI